MISCSSGSSPTSVARARFGNRRRLVQLVTNSAGHGAVIAERHHHTSA